MPQHLEGPIGPPGVLLRLTSQVLRGVLHPCCKPVATVLRVLRPVQQGGVARLLRGVRKSIKSGVAGVLRGVAACAAAVSCGGRRPRIVGRLRLARGFDNLVFALIVDLQ